MNILERYIFRKAAVSTVASLTALVSIVWIVQALSRVDIVKTSASAAGSVLWLALMLLPNLAAGVVPFAILLGAVQTLNSLNQDSERAVMAASGASQWVAVKPVLLLGTIGALFMLVISHWVGPLSASAFQNGLRSVNADTITLFLQPGRFEEVQEGLVLSVGDTRGSTLSDLVISDRRNAAEEMTYFARRAMIYEDPNRSLLVLQDGQLHRRDPVEETSSVIDFQAYAFDLATLRPTNQGDWIRTSERSTAELMFPAADDPLNQANPGALREELTARMTNWLLAIAFALWAVVVAGSPTTNRGFASPAMLFGLAGAIVLQALTFVALSLVETMPLAVIAAAGLPLSAILLNTILIARNFDPATSRLYQGSGQLIEWIQRRLDPQPTEEPKDLAGARP